MARLEDFRSGKISLSRHSLVSSLSLISALVLGAGTLLPTWTSPQVHIRDSVTEHSADEASQHKVWPGEQPELTLQGQVGLHREGDQDDDDVCTECSGSYCDRYSFLAGALAGSVS